MAGLYPAPGLPNLGDRPVHVRGVAGPPVRGCHTPSMWLTLRRLIALLVKLTLPTLKLDDQPAHLFRQSGIILDLKLLSERVSKNLDYRLFHDW